MATMLHLYALVLTAFFQQSGGIHWSIAVTRGKDDVPKSVMYLIVNKKSIWYTVVEGNAIKPMDRELWEPWRVPKGAMQPAFRWFAGAGDLFYLKKTGNLYRVFHRSMDEGATKDEPDRAVFKFTLK